MHGPALPVTVFVGFHFVKVGVFADGLVHWLFEASEPRSTFLPTRLLLLEYPFEADCGSDFDG
jgi:hypothetical protein